MAFGWLKGQEQQETGWIKRKRGWVDDAKGNEWMSAVKECGSLDEVRAEIDRIDRGIVQLLAERGGFVKQAARFKKTTDDVKAPARVEQVIAKVRALADAAGGEPAVVEAVYRAMIAAFIEREMIEHAALAQEANKAR